MGRKTPYKFWLQIKIKREKLVLMFLIFQYLSNLFFYWKIIWKGHDGMTCGVWALVYTVYWCFIFFKSWHLSCHHDLFLGDWTLPSSTVRNMYVCVWDKRSKELRSGKFCFSRLQAVGFDPDLQHNVCYFHIFRETRNKINGKKVK